MPQSVLKTEIYPSSILPSGLGASNSCCLHPGFHVLGFPFSHQPLALQQGFQASLDYRRVACVSVFVNACTVRPGFVLESVVSDDCSNAMLLIIFLK